MARNTTDTEWQILNVLICSRCNLKTSDAALLQAHHCKPRNRQIIAGVSYSLVDAKFTCSLCTVELPETEFCEHLEGHLSLKPYVCKYCAKDFPTRDAICEHLRSFHQQDEQTFVLKLSGRTKEIIKKAKNHGKEFYKPLNVLVPKSNSVEVVISKTTTQNLIPVPEPKQKQLKSPVSSYSPRSGLESTTVRNTVPTTISSNSPLSGLGSTTVFNTVPTTISPVSSYSLPSGLGLTTIHNTVPTTISPVSSYSPRSGLGSTAVRNTVPTTISPVLSYSPRSGLGSTTVRNTVPTTISPVSSYSPRSGLGSTTVRNTVPTTISPVSSYSPLSGLGSTTVRNTVPTTISPVSSYSPLSGLGSTTVRNTVPTTISPVSLGAHARVVSQLNSNTVLASARPQLSAEQRRYFVVLTTQPQTGSLQTLSTNVLQTQAPSCLSQNVCAPASATSWRHPFAQKLPGQIIVPYVNAPILLQELQAQRGGIQKPATTLPNLVTHSLHSTAPSITQNINTRGIHMVTNVSPTSANQVEKAPALTVPPVFHLNQPYLSSPSVQNAPGTQMAATLTSSLVNNISAVTPNTHKAGNHPVPAVSTSHVNQPLAPAVTASTDGNSPLMSADVPVNCQSPTESDAGHIYKVSIQQFPTQVKSSVESDHVNGDFARNGNLQINQEASSSATEVIHEHSSAAAIKSEESTAGDTDCPLQIRIENIMSLSTCQGDFQQCVQDNTTDTIASTESSLTETGSNTTEHQFKTVESSNFSFLHVVKGYFLCLVCHMKWYADYDSFFKHIWEKHTHEADFSCCPTGYSPYCSRLEAIVKTIYDKSQEPMSDQIRSYFTPNSCIDNFTQKSCIETENEDVQNTSLSESSSSAPVSSRVETVKQINASECPSSTVPVRPNSAARDCEHILPAESVSRSSESSSPPTLILDQHRQIIENEQNYNFGPLTAGNELEKGAQDMQESVIQIGKQRADRENICSASELRDDLNFNDENLQNIMAIDLSSSASSISQKSNNKNSYEDISDDDSGGITDHNRGSGSINCSLVDSHYSDELPLDLSKKTAQSEKSHDSVTATPLLAAEMAAGSSVTHIQRMPPERIDNPHDSFTITPLSAGETAVTSSITHTERLLCESIAANPRTRTERLSTESIGMGDDDDISLRCFYECGICFISFPTAVELEVHVQRVHNLKQHLPCAHCGFRCGSSKDLIQHMEDHLASDNRKTFSCSLLENSDKVAQFENNDMKFIIRMLKTSLAANSDIVAVFHFACNMCQSEFADLDQLGLHIQESLLKVIECKHCASFFLNTFSWQNHMAAEHLEMPRMYCIKRKLLCCERKMHRHSNVPQQASQEDIPCLSNTERDAETTVQDYQCEGTHHKSHAMSRATANVLDETETDASNVIENSKVCSKDVELTETHSHHEGRNVADGITAQTTQNSSAIPNLLDLVKASKAMKRLISAVSLNTGKASDEQGAVANTDPNCIERRRNSVAQEHCESGRRTTTIHERRRSVDVDLHGLMRPVSSHVNNELREIVSEVTAIKASMGGNDGLMQIENSGNKEEYVQPVLNTSTSIDSRNSVKSALSRDEDNLTNTELDYEDQCCQEVVAEIPLGVQSSSHDNVGRTVSENISTSSYSITVPLNDHCLNEESESCVVGQAEAVGEISKSRVKHDASSSAVGNTDASSDLDQATSVESQDGCDVTSDSSSDKVSCKLPQTSDCSVGSKDYFNITPTALSLPVTRVSDCANSSASNVEMAEIRTILCVSEQNKLEYTENTCLPVQDIGADIDNRQESRHSSVVLENNLMSGVQHDMEHGISNVVKDGEDQASSVAVNRQKPTESLVFQQTVTGASVINHNFESAHDSETNINDLLKESCINNRSHCTPDVSSVLKTVSHGSDDIPNPATNCLGPDHDTCHDIDFSSSNDPACTLQESVDDFVGNVETLENDISCGQDILHLNIDKTSSHLMQVIQAEKQETKKGVSCDEIHYNKNSLVSTKSGQLYASNETSACIENSESRETREENVFSPSNSPPYNDNLVVENNNTISVDQTLIASNITENTDSSHTETNGLPNEITIEDDFSNSHSRCNCGTLISCFTDDDHNVQPEDKSLKISFTGKCAKCRLVTDKRSHPDNTTEHVNSETVDTPSKDGKSLSEKAVENCLRALKRRAPLILESSGKISRLENVSSDDVMRSKADPPESSIIKPHVQSGHSKTCVGSEILKANPALKSGNGSIVLSESMNTARDLTTSNRDMFDTHCKRKSEAGHGEGIITSKLLIINSEKHKPEDTDKKLERSVSQSPKDIQGADVTVSDSARFRCSACPFFTSQSYTELKQHVKSQHPQDKSARVCRIRSRSSQNAEEQSERWEDATQSLQEVQNNDATMSYVHDEITNQQTRINSETNIGYHATVNKSEDKQKERDKLDKLKEIVIMQEVSKVAKKSLTKVESVDILKSDSNPHFKCSVCIFLTSHSYTEIQQHVKSQHSDDKSAKVNRIHPKCLLSAEQKFAGSESPKEANDLTSTDVKQYFKCSVCISLSSHSYTEMKQHILLQHPHDISARICRVHSKSSHNMDKERSIGIYKCIHPKCTFTRKWNLGKMKAHVKSKHPYYSCGYCKAPYNLLPILYKHLQFVHRNKKPRIMAGTIALDLLFTRVDIPYNGQSAECTDITLQTPAMRKKHSQSSLRDDVTKSEAKSSSELQVLEMKRHTRLKSCDVASDQQNQPLEGTKIEKTSKDNDENHSTAAQGLKTSQCKLPHSKSESILEQILKEISPVSEHEVSSAEKLTVTSKTAAISNNGDSLSTKADRNLFKTTMSIEIPQFDHAALLDNQASGSKVSSTVTEESNRKAEKSTSNNTISSKFAKTIDHTHRMPPTVSLFTKKTVANQPNATAILSPQSAENNASGNTVTEYQESDQHFSAQHVSSKMRSLGPMSSENTVRKGNNSAATSNHSDINVNSSTDVQSSSTIKNQELNSVDISDKQESSNRHGNAQETFPEILCSETASCVSDTVSLHHTATAASAIVTQDKKDCGTLMASQLETKTAAEGDENKNFVPGDLRTHSENKLSMPNGSETESMCENAATKHKKPHKSKLLCKHDYPFRCTVCSMILKCVRDIERHYNSVHAGKDVQLTERKSGFVYSNSGKCLRWKNDKTGPTDAYMCSYCAFRNMKRFDVEEHIRSVHPEREVKVFSFCKPKHDRHSSRSELTSKLAALPHEASRSNSPTPSSYFCNVCNDVKSSEFQYRLHLASHPCYKHTTQLTAGASFICHTCGYIAKSSSDFAQHTGEHISERRFKCFMCEHDSHNKKSMRAHIKSAHNKTVDDDVGIIDRDKQRNVDLRPKLVNIDPKVFLIDPFRQQPNYLQQLVLKHGIKSLDLPGDICAGILTCEQDKYGKYFDINKIM